MTDAARELERSKMARFEERSGNLGVTELGRVASHYYIRHSSIVTFNELLKNHMTEPEVWALRTALPLCFLFTRPPAVGVRMQLLLCP